MPLKRHLAMIAKSSCTHLDWTFHPACMGAGRFSNERWVTSHPSAMPCDLDAAGVWWCWRGEECVPTPLSCRPELKHEWGRKALHEQAPEEFVWLMAPWGELDAPKKNEADPNGCAAHLDPTLGRMLLMWLHLFGEAPPLSSWVWKCHPDGEQWKVGFQRCGKDVIDRLLPASEMQSIC